ncbi:MAG: hypothetical protein R3F34_00265 [Planctomycetota bacterium]
MAPGPHADAWTGAAVRKLSGDFSNQDCIDCHAPQPIFVTGIGNRVLPRMARRPEGVDCIACHAMPDGRVAGTYSDEKPACRPAEAPDLSRPEFCSGCHNQHLTVDQWKDSSWAERRITCLDCHMPYRDGTQSSGRDHSMHGGLSLDMLKMAVELTGARSTEADGGNGWVVTLDNVGAGHKFPTDDRSRAADLFWRPLSEPDGPWRHLHRFRSPYRYETDVPDTLLDVDSKESFAIVDQGTGAPVDAPIEVVLYYKRSPFYRDMSNPEQDTWPTDPSVDPYESEIPRDAVLVHRIVLGGADDAK